MTSLEERVSDLKEKETISFNGYTVRKIHGGYEVNRGEVLVKGNYGYLSYNLRYSPSKLNGIENIEHWGGEESELSLPKYPKECNEDFDVFHLEDEDSFTLDTGFYGVVTFSVMTIEELDNEYNKIEEKEEEETVIEGEPEVEYWIRQAVMFIQTVDGRSIACIEAPTMKDFHTDNPWRKIVLNYGDSVLAVEALSHFTGKKYRIHQTGCDTATPLKYKGKIKFNGEKKDNDLSVPENYDKELWEEESKHVLNYTFAKKVPHKDSCPFTICL